MPGNVRSVERAAILLANTVFAVRGRAGDAIEDAGALDGWLARHAGVMPDAPRALDGHALRTLRDAVRELLAALAQMRAPAAEAVSVVNRASQRVPTASALEWSEARPVLRLEPCSGDGSDRFLAFFARAAIELVTGPWAGHVCACGGPRCVQFLVRDHPRQAYCSEGCATRARSARYYRKHRPAV